MTNGTRRLEGRVAVVTGGAIGIGAAYSRALAGAGAAVVIADVADGAALEQELRAAGARALYVQCDVSDALRVRELVDAALAFGGHIDILVNNAALFATLPPATVAEIDVELWDRVMAVNVRGPFLLAKYVTPHMIAQRYGKIVNITSGVAYKGLGGMAHYAASKGALTTLTRSLSKELGPYNVCVNSLAPGAIMSETIARNAAHIEKYHSHAIAQRAIKRDGYPEDLLGALLFLASADSDFVTGQTLAVDGGSLNL